MRAAVRFISNMNCGFWFSHIGREVFMAQGSLIRNPFRRHGSVFLFSILLLAGMLTAAGSAGSVYAQEDPPPEPPQIVSDAHFSASVVATGTYVSAGVSASGTGPLAFTWYHNDAWFASGASIGFNAAKSHNGSYYCIVSNAAGSARSSTISLDVGDPPQITSFTWSTAYVSSYYPEPNVLEDRSITFSVSVTGDGVFSYKWLRNSAVLADPGGSYYTVSTAAEADNLARYSCIVSSKYGSASAQRTLNVILKPRVVEHPQNTVAAGGMVAAFYTRVRGSRIISAEWSKDGVALAAGVQTREEANNFVISSLVYSPEGVGDSGSRFRATLRNEAGEITTNEALLEVPPNSSDFEITEHPSDQSVNLGQMTTLRVVVVGSAPVTYQWKRVLSGQVVSEIVPGATQAEYTFPAAPSDNDARYFCTVKSADFELSSNYAAIRIKDIGPEIAEPLPSATVAEGSLHTFYASVNNSALGLIHWERNGQEIPGAWGSSYTVVATREENGVRYCYVITGSFGTVRSNEATLTVVPGKPVIVSQPPERKTVKDGSTVRLAVGATGSNLRYRWERNGRAISGASSSRYSFKAVRRRHNGSIFVCAVSNAAGAVRTRGTRLRVLR